MSTHDRSLDILVIGAGIGGLATALAIARSLNGSQAPSGEVWTDRQSRHKITVLERYPSLREVGAGIQIPPNACRILCSWGLRSEFEAVIFLPDWQEMREYKDGKAFSRVPMNIANTAEKNYGFPHWVVHRADYQDILAKAAVNQGVEIRFAQRVESIDAEANEVILAGSVNERISADLIIGADGVFSIARKAIPVNDGIEPYAAGMYCFRYLVKREKMLQNPLTAELIADNVQATSWNGPSRLVLGYPIASGQLYNVLAVVMNSSDGVLGRYNQPGNPAELRECFKEFDPVCRALLSHAGSDTDGCSKWSLTDMPELKSWRRDNGRVVLVGDAAHNMLPWAASGASSSIEDAEVLAICLSHTLNTSPGKSNLDCVAQATALYEAIRRPRATRLQEISRENGQNFSLPEGPLKEARDAKLKEAMYEQEKRLEEGRDVDRNLTKPDITAKWPQPEARMWMYSYDAKRAFEEQITRIDGQASGVLLSA